MSNSRYAAFGVRHDHVFLGTGHQENERRTWAVIALCGAMMVAEIIGGSLFGSLALVADGLHMSTHAGAMLIAALAYSYARRHAHDSRFVFGTGKLGDLAGFSSAIVLAMIALLIGYEAVARFLAPVPIHFGEAISIAVLGLAVNLASVWLLSGSHHGHSHEHSHDHGHGHDNDAHAHSEPKRIYSQRGIFEVSIAEDDFPPIFQIAPSTDNPLPDTPVSVTILRPDGSRQVFPMRNQGRCLESIESIPEPHEFKAIVQFDLDTHEIEFVVHHHDDLRGAVARDHNIRSAYVHVIADAAVSVLAIVGLVLARTFGWVWMDPLAGIIGALVIANWSYGLMRDTGAILLDMNPDRRIANGVRRAIEAEGDEVVDLHVWRLGPGHMSAVVSIATSTTSRDSRFYHETLKRFQGLSHVTVEVMPHVAVM